ncbi:hypothetical protein [Herbihabitans rhizosphaerae]|uniref:hypothetical protein n=1 Tax=Herbihabitans rhizosphaerae TaxID=1872711 RepID=UPI00102BCEEC|nr:hypothetical protein [Herbihabitans rhizosphaerae]
MKPNSLFCTSLFDITDDHQQLTIHLAAIDTYSITLDLDSVRKLHQAVEDRVERTITGTHPLHGKQKIRLTRCFEGMELSATASQRPAIHIRYARERQTVLVDTMAEIVRVMVSEHSPGGG